MFSLSFSIWKYSLFYVANLFDLILFKLLLTSLLNYFFTENEAEII